MSKRIFSYSADNMNLLFSCSKIMVTSLGHFDQINLLTIKFDFISETRANNVCYMKLIVK